MAAIFNLIFIICLVLAVVFFVISLILFFLFDIRGIFNIRTGRAAAKSIKELEAENQTTGRLSSGKKKKTTGKAQYRPQPPKAESNRTDDKTMRVTAQQLSAAIPQSAPERPQTGLPDTAEQTALLDRDMAENNGETELLTQTDPEPKFSETTVLSEAAPRTGGDAAVGAAEEEEGFTQPLDRVRMKIIKKIVFRDTDEVIA